ncbi:single-stranded DNA-binding protein [Candidatus Gottesmanbacteria bacterium]|nr:single-stranded DNA-binding protein [Candidatus Gottesmanbacteria bacterium]
MASRSLNKVILIGNLTRDPELRYTPSGTAVCTFGLATNRSWTTQSGEVKEDTEFHRIVSWNKLAELCSQLLTKGRKVYVEGRLSTRTWTAQDNTQKTTTEIVIEDMIILDSRKHVLPPKEVGMEMAPSVDMPAVAVEPAAPVIPTPPPTPVDDTGKKKSSKSDDKKKEKEEEKSQSEDINPDDIPF